MAGPSPIRTVIQAWSNRWLLEPVLDGTSVTLDWRPQVAKPIVPTFTPALRPLFRANHGWTMKRGQERILELWRLCHRRGDKARLRLAGRDKSRPYSVPRGRVVGAGPVRPIVPRRSTMPAPYSV